MQLLPTVPNGIVLGDDLDMIRMRAYLVSKVRPWASGRYKLLSVERDAKTKKNSKRGILTGILYLAPANLSGSEICPSRTKGCSVACLWTSGHGAYKNVKEARLRKTYVLLNEQEKFMSQIFYDMNKLAEEASDRGMMPAVRLNGTSDIAWENIPVLDSEYPHIFAAQPDIQAYDYTKVLSRLDDIAGIPNYSVVFSRGETKKSQADADKALGMGVPITVVFDELPMIYKGMKVVNGDTDDWRPADILMADDKPTVIGLIAKGKARYDKSGFVVRDGDPGYNE
ncbi:MAG: GP88 family protein [Planctomycetota bacterium]|jgi:hypothetical protein